jgi:uncharacterized phage-associated protein
MAQPASGTGVGVSEGLMSPISRLQCALRSFFVRGKIAGRLSGSEMTQIESDIRFNYEKFRTTVHVVCAACADSALGRVKLHKILYFADFLRYLKTGEPLTGEDYLKQKFGPTARHLNKALRELEEMCALKIETQPFHGYVKYAFTSLRTPETNQLSADEIALLDEVIDFVCRQTATQISEFSHAEPWALVDMGERIPYFAAFGMAPAEIEADDLDWAKDEAERLLLTA